MTDVMTLNEALVVWYASNGVYQTTVVTILVKTNFCITHGYL